MTDKEKREFKDGVISIFKRFNILDHTATIGGLRDNILRYIDSMQKEPINYNKLNTMLDESLAKETKESWEEFLQEEPKKCMYSKDNYTDKERRVLCKDCDEECEYAKKKVLVSEELEEAACEYDNSHIDDNNLAFKAGANWQKEKMMKDAVETVVQTNSMSGNTAVVHLDCKYKAGDKVRVIIIKEE